MNLSKPEEPRCSGGPLSDTLVCSLGSSLQLSHLCAPRQGPPCPLAGRHTALTMGGEKGTKEQGFDSLSSSLKVSAGGLHPTESPTPSPTLQPSSASTCCLSAPLLMVKPLTSALSALLAGLPLWEGLLCLIRVCVNS